MSPAALLIQEWLSGRTKPTLIYLEGSWLERRFGQFVIDPPKQLLGAFDSFFAEPHLFQKVYMVAMHGGQMSIEVGIAFHGHLVPEG